MTTTVRSTRNVPAIDIRRQSPTLALVGCSAVDSPRPHNYQHQSVEISALLDAVRSELGVLIIDKAALPEVREEHGVNHNHLVAGAVAVQDDDVSDLWFKARSFIAIALHREAHPPVDEQQVEQIWNTLIEVGMDDADGPTLHLVATRLATAGYRIEKVQS